MLLLARSAGEWWDRLGIDDPAAWDLVQAARAATIELPAAVAADLPDTEVVAMAARAFAAELGLPVKVVEIRGAVAGRRVLDLHAAALVGLLDETGTQLVQVNVGDVLGELLRHEQHFWYDSARAAGLTGGQAGITQRQLRQVIATACLLGAATEQEARVLPGRVPGLSPSMKIAEWLKVLYPPGPGETDWIGSLQPDRLAELHTLRELTKSPELAQACLASLNPRQALRAVTLLARAASDYPQAEELLRQILPSIADVVADLHAPAETLTVIYNAIPYPTIILAPAAAALCQRIISLLPGDTSPAVRAFWLSNLGVRFSALGGPADALPAEQEAVAIRRDLAAAMPDRYRPALADSLSNLGVWFSELGRPADALPVTEEAVAIRRELAAAMPDRYRPALATSLSNLGVWFSALGRPADALPAEQEAVAIRRDLAAAMPDRYRPALATSLSNLAEALSSLDRAEEAGIVQAEADEMVNRGD